MASLVDFYKQKLAPKLSGFANQLSQTGLIGIGGAPSVAPIQVEPAKKFVSGVLKPAANAVGTLGKLSYDALVKQPAKNRQMQIDTQKAIDASNRALQTAKAAREAGRPDLAAQYTRSMMPQLQAESNRFAQSAKEAQEKRNALISSGVRTGLYASAAAAPVASLAAGGLNAGLGATFAGQTSPEQIGESFGEGFKYGGMPNPIIKGGLLAKSVGGGLVNLAEDYLYAKTVENRKLTPQEIAVSFALPGVFETGAKLLKSVKGKQKVQIQTSPEGLMFNKNNQLFDPINGRFAKNTQEARLAAKNTKDFISAGGKPVKAGTNLIEMSDGKWVDEQDLVSYASKIDTPKLEVQSDLLSEARKYKSAEEFVTDNGKQFLQSVRSKFPDNNEKEMFDYAKKIAELRGSKNIDVQDIAEAVQYSNPATNKGMVESGVSFESLLSKERSGTELLDRAKEVGVKGIDTSIYNVRDQVKNKILSQDKDVQSFIGAIAKRDLEDQDGRISKRGLEILNNIIPGGKNSASDIAKRYSLYNQAKGVAQGGEKPIVDLAIKTNSPQELAYTLSRKLNNFDMGDIKLTKDQKIELQQWDNKNGNIIMSRGITAVKETPQWIKDAWNKSQESITKPQTQISVAQGGVGDTATKPNAFQDILPSKTKPEAVKNIVNSGGNPLYHDTNADGVIGILDSGEIRPNQAPLSSLAGQGKRVSTTRNFDNYSRYHNSPYRFIIDETKTGQKSIPDNRAEFESIFTKPIKLNSVGAIGIDTTNPAILQDIKSGKLEGILNKAKEKGMSIQLFEGKVLPDKFSNRELQQLTKTEVTNLVTKSPSPTGGAKAPVKVKPLKEVYKEKLTKGESIPQLDTLQETIQPSSIVESGATPLLSTKPQPELQKVQTLRTLKEKSQPLENIISEARKQIGTTPEPKDKSVRQVMDDLYTQWVDRYNPLTKASQKAKETLKGQGAMLRPENDPEYLVRRLTGAGGIADARFKTELNPILKEMESLNIPKSDMDVYLANKRMAGFGTAGREIYGADPVKSGQVVSALETKYPQIKQIADKMYAYQDKGLQEIADAGFLSPEAIASIKSQNPDYAPLYRVQDEMDNYLGLPTRKTMQGSQPISKIKGSTRQIESPVESIIGNTFRQRAAIEKNRVAQSIVSLQNVADMGFKKVSNSAPDTITVWNNGKKEYWQVGQEIADTAKGVNEESMNLVLKIMQAPAALLRQGATGRNPEFLFPNAIRDQIDAAVTSKYGYIPFVDYFSGLRSMVTKDDIYQKWLNSGARIDLGELSGKKSISQLFDSKVKKKGLFGWLGQGLDLLGSLSEQPTRVGLFKKAYQKTGNELIAAMESRDATVDFARMGSKMKVANSIIPFLNVGVQGFDKLIRSVKSNPGKVLLNATIYGTLPAIATTVYNLTNFPEEYNEIPQYDKDSNFVIVTGRNEDGTVDYLTFPKGNVIPTIANPAESLVSFLYGNDQQSFGNLLTSTISNTLPVVGDGQTLGEVATKTVGGLIPQAIKPLAENLLNKSFYKYDPKKETTKEIVPYYMQNRPAYQQTYEFTPQIYQKLGAIFNASPLKVKNLMEGYLAGYTKIPSQVIESLNNISQGKEVSNNDKTILRRFIKTTYPSSGKPAEEKPKAPGLMERVTGKAGASETSIKKVIPQWQIDNEKEKLKSSDKTSVKVGDFYLVKQTNGDVTRLDVSRVKNMPSSTNYEKVKKETEKWKLADDVLKLDPKDQESAFKDLGIPKADAEYYQVAKDTTEAKVAYIKDQVQGVRSYEDFLRKVLPLAKEVNGQAILSSGVIDWLYSNDIINSAQKKQLKSLEYKNGQVGVKTGSTGGTKYVEAKIPGGSTSFKALPKVKRVQTKQYKLVVPKAK